MKSIRNAAPQDLAIVLALLQPLSANDNLALYAVALASAAARLALSGRDPVTCLQSLNVCDGVQGIRGAVPQDLAAIQALLQPLEARGVLAPRTHAQLLTDLRHFRVAERDAKVGGYS